MNPMRPFDERAQAELTDTIKDLKKEFGHVVDVDMSLRRFVAYYSEGQTSRNWPARFTRWVLEDAGKAMAVWERATDDLGTPLRQRSSTTEPLTPDHPDYVSMDDLAAEAR